MNFTRAERWTTKESFNIQSNYGIHLSNIECNSLAWKSCTYTEKTNNCGHGEDIFLSCTGTYRVLESCICISWEVLLTRIAPALFGLRQAGAKDFHLYIIIYIPKFHHDHISIDQLFLYCYQYYTNILISVKI